MTSTKNVDLHKIMETQCQHLTVTQNNDLIKLLHSIEELFDETIVTYKIDPVDFELNRMQRQYACNHIQYQSCTRKCSKMRLNI